LSEKDEGGEREENEKVIFFLIKPTW